MGRLFGLSMLVTVIACSGCSDNSSGSDCGTTTDGGQRSTLSVALFMVHTELGKINKSNTLNQIRGIKNTSTPRPTEPTPSRSSRR